jgi:hypothetical protein
MFGNTSLGQIQRNSKYEIRFPFDGRKRVWAQYDDSSPLSELWLDLEYRKTYYIKMQLVKGTTHANPELILLDSIQGKEEFINVAPSASLVCYPVPLKLPEAALVGNPFNRKTLEPFYYNATDSLYFWKYRFKGPAYFQYFYWSDKFIYQFAYGNTLLSPTYSEFLRIQGSGVKEMKSNEDLLDYIKKSLGKSKDKKEKLVSLDYQPVNAIGEFGWMAISEIEDHDAANKGENDFLLLREIRACIYKDTKEKKKALIILWLSERGTPDELYTLDELKERLKQFIDGWVLRKDIKTGELSTEATAQKQ